MTKHSASALKVNPYTLQQSCLDTVEKNKTKCTKCGICKRVCPTQVTEVYDKRGGDVTTSGCTLFFKCVEMFPEKDALKAQIANKNICKSKNWLNTT